MRLIDAEKCPCKGCSITYCHENCKKYYAWLNGCDYDVEAVVAELEASAEGAKDSKDLSKWSAYQKAISIVRGKE